MRAEIIKFFGTRELWSQRADIPLRLLRARIIVFIDISSVVVWDWSLQNVFLACGKRFILNKEKIGSSLKILQQIKVSNLFYLSLIISKSLSYLTILAKNSANLHSNSALYCFHVPPLTFNCFHYRLCVDEVLRLVWASVERQQSIARWVSFNGVENGLG